MKKFIIPFCNRFLFVFIIGFIVTIPINFYFFPDLGSILSVFTEGFVQLFLQDTAYTLHSDSLVMYIWVVLLFILSVLISFVWTLIQKKEKGYISLLVGQIATYYLSLILLIYGFNKVFNYQFYFPEPNTIFTPLGQLSPDILFWSSMGSSFTYSFFAGLIELIPAILLLFKKTRLLGAIIAFGVLVNVAMLNFGFNISVKIFSLFLVFLSLVVLQPDFKRLAAFFLGNSVIPQKKADYKFTSNTYKKAYPYVKVLLIGLLLFETLGGYFHTGYFNGAAVPKTIGFGAYNLNQNSLNIKKVFIHSKGYFIIESNGDNFQDYKMEWLDKDNLELTNYANQKTILLAYWELGELRQLEGDLFGDIIKWELNRIDLETLPIYQTGFTWVSDL